MLLVFAAAAASPALTTPCAIVVVVAIYFSSKAKQLKLFQHFLLFDRSFNFHRVQKCVFFFSLLFLSRRVFYFIHIEIILPRLAACI